jgi:hypothetical protein
MWNVIYHADLFIFTFICPGILKYTLAKSPPPPIFISVIFVLSFRCMFDSQNFRLLLPLHNLGFYQRIHGRINQNEQAFFVLRYYIFVRYFKNLFFNIFLQVLQFSSLDKLII